MSATGIHRNLNKEVFKVWHLLSLSQLAKHVPNVLWLSNDYKVYFRLNTLHKNQQEFAGRGLRVVDNRFQLMQNYFDFFMWLSFSSNNHRSNIYRFLFYFFIITLIFFVFFMHKKKTILKLVIQRVVHSSSGAPKEEVASRLI